MKKVLIAEDSKTLNTALKQGLKPYEKEFEVIFVENGLDAMNILGEQFIDLVVTDIHMPMIDGLVLLAYMLENCPKTACIIMSAYGDDTLKAEVRDSILCFLDKPVDPNKLAKLIHDTLTDKSGKRRVKNVSMPDFLQMIMMGKKTCVLQLKSNEGAHGVFYFNAGEPFQIVCGKLKGEEAFKEMLNWTAAEVKFLKPPAEKGRKQINLEMPELINMAKIAKIKIQVKKERLVHSL